MDIDIERLKKIQDYFAQYRVIPSYARIGAMVGIKSKNGVSRFLARLKLRGYMDQTPDGRLSPTSRFFERPLAGVAPAGFASPAAELMGDSITIDEYLVEHPSSTVLVEVNGDSMIGAGINDGDMLVVERESNPDTGRIVVAIVDGDFTIKYLQRDRKGYYLQPANPNFSNIRPQGSLEIYGVVVGQFRKI